MNDNPLMTVVAELAIAFILAAAILILGGLRPPPVPQPIHRGDERRGVHKEGVYLRRGADGAELFMVKRVGAEWWAWTYPRPRTTEGTRPATCMTAWDAMDPAWEYLTPLPGR